MNSIPPIRSASMVEKISSEVQSLLPKDSADIVAQYADEVAEAENAFEFDSNYDIIDSEKNRNIRAAIKRIFTSSSDPARKVLVFKNARNIFEQRPQ